MIIDVVKTRPHASAWSTTSDVQLFDHDACETPVTTRNMAGHNRDRLHLNSGRILLADHRQRFDKFAPLLHPIDEVSAKALFDGRTSAQLLSEGFIALGGQIIDATQCRWRSSTTATARGS